MSFYLLILVDGLLLSPFQKKDVFNPGTLKFQPLMWDFSIWGIIVLQSWKVFTIMC